ncbi:MAG: type I glyceraldehyde-3-phosphate dehydrogenase [Bacteroidota bacterium]|nr:type I glyceraldehyde-3-phosphate dehydrogenase [Bacteroidota bacterium]
MTKLKIGINGFGRVGRLALREILKRNDIEVVGINDLLEAEHLAYLFKYDSVHGKFDGTIEVQENNLIVNGNSIRVTAEKNPKLLKWNEVQADIILECTGLFTTQESANQHIKAGAKKVLISAPSKDVAMYVMGVNHTNIKSSDVIISNSSCTTNCLAPLIKVLNDNFGVEEALMTTVHALTASQMVVDGPSKKDFRGGRAAASNIIPSTTGAAKAVTKVIPELKGKLTGMAFRVPVLNVSAVDLTVKLQKETTYEDIISTYQKAANSSLKGILAVTTDDVVSQDFVGDTHICIVDTKAGIALNSTFYKIVAWYDNEYGYAAKLVDLAQYVYSLK